MYSFEHFKLANDVVKCFAKAQTQMGIRLACGDKDIVWIEVGSEHDLAEMEADSDPAKNKVHYIKRRGLY